MSAWTRRGRSKFGAVRTEIDGIVFASKKEAKRYLELKLLLQIGEIHDLELQPAFPLIVRHITDHAQATAIGKYRADFRYREGPTGILVIEDVKSSATKTTAYRLRKRFVEAQYGISIREV